MSITLLETTGYRDTPISAYLQNETLISAPLGRGCVRGVSALPLAVARVRSIVR